MKVLYLVDPQQDYLTSMIFEGLCSVLGNGNVYVYPMLKRWKTGEDDSWYILPDGKKGWTKASEYEHARPDLPESSIDDIVKDIMKFDMIIVSSPREYTVRSFREIKSKLGVIPIPVIFMDGEDGANIQEQLIDEFQPKVIFKREIFYDAEYKGKKIYPLPFAAFQGAKPGADQIITKDLDVFGMFGYTSNLRMKMVTLFHELNIGGNHIVDIDSKRVPGWDLDKPRRGKTGYTEYINTIARSKIGLSLPGHGKDTVRYWEIPNTGTLMFAVNPKLAIPFPFTHKENVIFIKDDLSNFEEEIKYYLSHDKEREELAAACHEHLMKFHTCEKRVHYMLSIIEGECR